MLCPLPFVFRFLIICKQSKYTSDFSVFFHIYVRDRKFLLYRLRSGRSCADSQRDECVVLLKINPIAVVRRKAN